MKCGVIVFPGSNCDDDLIHVVGHVCGQNVVKLWHKETSIEGFTSSDIIFIPGGFSYGDYLRSGAIARFANIMDSLVEFAQQGGRIVGICNGFQVLCEVGLLPGVLLRNKNQKFVSKTTSIKVENNHTAISKKCGIGEVLSIPSAHAEGRYYASDKVIEELEENNQVIFRYCDRQGKVTADANFNGSVNNIAGIMNAEGNVFGMMPHPERAAESDLGNSQGLRVFESLFALFP